ncbi:branched-chain amino acid ABC transporter substrate-binding protein (plasmid) [Rhizobium sp. CB3171]|uniref:branched-chain amino acid ABC transporter substrate-binding protein n=1 Tax=Rhizobium sp. CB3171 TaxID=3039157 RepID=UPI0024B1A0FA|nr:branched-chain amino acid ABC transporter substrate-binding protein [Rhizobium sp. CB3171]WFU07171.1 branched-chain amino acid ABC transporter substrate-binding protein [Rhizobium sp. CB3171]
MKNHALLGTTFAASLAFVAPAHADFTIGIIAPLTGPGAADGNKVKSAMQAAADEINKNGGILGDNLFLKFGDDTSDPLKTSSIAKDFLDEKVNFVIEAAVFDPPPPIQVRPESPSDILALAGTYLSHLTKTSPLPKLIDGGRTSNLSTECYRNDPRQAVIAANYVLRNFKDKKIAILDDKTNYSKPLVDTFKTTLNKGGVTEALTISVDPSVYDYRHEAEKQDVEKLKQTGVQVIYYGGHYPGLDTLVQQLRESSVKLQIIGGDALSNVNYQTSAHKEADGTIFTDAPRETLTTDLESARAALKAHETPVEDLTLRSYAAVHEVASGIKDELCYGHSEFSLVTDIKDGKPTIYLDPRAVAVRLSADEAIPVAIDEATGNRMPPSFSFYMWKAGKTVPINETPQGN